MGWGTGEIGATKSGWKFHCYNITWRFLEIWNWSGQILGQILWDTQQ